MKRMLGWAGAVVATLGVALPAIAVPDGPDGDVDGKGYFIISISEDMNNGDAPPEPADTYERFQFNLDEGWDFGDRLGYDCAWVEYFAGEDELFEVHFQLRDDYRFALKINDKYGEEGDHSGGLCGNGVGKGAVPKHDGTDHFPHMIHPGDGLTFTWNGEQVAFLSLAHDHCDKAYWTPGDEPGEAWLWWDEDGPKKHMPGHPLDCGGGPGKPRAVVRASVRGLADGVVACVRDELDGDMCTE